MLSVSDRVAVEWCKQAVLVEEEGGSTIPYGQV